MKTPLYAQCIIVGIKYKKAFHWYIAEKELWYIDYDIVGYPTNSYPSEREGLTTLNKKTFEVFLKNIDHYQVSTQDLQNSFLKAWEKDKINAKYDYSPALFLDFDCLHLYSQFPETTSFEEYLPKKWKGYHQNFFNKINKTYRYWECGNINYFELIKK